MTFFGSDNTTRKKKFIESFAFFASVLLVLVIPSSTPSISYAEQDYHESTGHNSTSHDYNNTNTENPNHDNSTGALEHENGNNNQTSGESEPQQNEHASQNATSSDNNSTSHENRGNHSIGDTKRELQMNGHDAKIARNETLAKWYLPKMTFTLDANGTALAMSNHTGNNPQNASLTITMTVWKSWRSLVWMHIDNGTIKVGNYTSDIHGGLAYYLKSHSRLLITAYTPESGNATKENPATHYEHSYSVLRIHTSSQDAPTKPTAGPLPFNLIGLDSHNSTMWFLRMKGDLTLSS